MGCTGNGMLRKVQSRSLQWSGHIDRIGVTWHAYRNLVEKPLRKDYLED